MTEPALSTAFSPRVAMADAAALRMRGASIAEVEAFCALSPEHRRAYEAADAVWRLTGEMGGDHPVFATERTNVRIFRPRRRTVMALCGALAACLVLAVAPDFVTRLSADYVTGTGATQSITLSDGTKVILAPQTALAVDMQGPARQVRLLKGRAWFEVAKNPQRPFAVDTRDLKVTVTGTQFDLGRVGDRTDVALVEGSVRVEYQGRQTTLSPGQALRFDSQAHKARTQAMPVSGIAAWRRGRLLVQDMRVGDIVARLRPYHSGLIVIADRTLSDRRVAGAFDLSDPQKALEAVVAPYGGRVHPVSPYILIVSQN